MNKKILALAIPNIISNITVPLLGLVDIAIVGHLGGEHYIGAIALGGMLFSIMYWNFGFLRMGTSGFTAQAYGKRDLSEAMSILFRAISVGLIISALLIALQEFIVTLVFRFLESGKEVESLAKKYFSICIWGAPAVLGLYSFKGWYIGMQNARFPMMIAISINVVNILASLFFVYVLDMKIEGVALGTLISQYVGLLMAIFLWLRYYKKLANKAKLRESLAKTEMLSFFHVNSYIFLRTMCLTVVTAFFTSSGANRSDMTLAVNTLLMQFFTIFSYFMDGFAFAGEALAGRYIGASNMNLLRISVKMIFRWGWALAFLFTLLYAFGGEMLISFLTNDTDVLNATKPFVLWIAAVPLAGFSAFLWDGIFIGATAGREMGFAMVIATLSFFLIYFLLSPFFGNHALWIAFLSYLAMRGIVQALWFKDIRNRSIPHIVS